MTAPDAARALRYLANGPASVEAAADPHIALLRGEGRATIAVSREAIAELVRQKRVRRQGRLIARASPQASGVALTVERRETPHGFDMIAVDAAESPLAVLRRMKGRDGAPFFDEAGFRAGERLRADFTRGGVMPRLSANWEASVSSGRRAGGVAELTEAALASRFRVDRALDAVGPELSGLLIDVCCFLKGLEQMEMERGLPARSAKVLLKAGLSMLARHYEPAAEPVRTRRHWGAADYRPSIDAGGS